MSSYFPKTFSYLNSSPRGFTLVELLASIAIVAVLSWAAIPFVGNYLSEVRATADKSILITLNDAVHTYGLLGGDLTALTQDAPIGHVLERLCEPITEGGVNRAPLNASFTYPAASLSASGNYMRYHFTRANSYTQGN